MAPLTKDAVETGISAQETATSQPSSQASSQAKSGAGGHMRSDAVSLEVPVKVHGSRVTEVVRGVTPHTEPFEEQTTTMIVFPQGGVLRMNTSVGVGQMLVLTNLKSKQDAICRVLKVRSFPNMQAYVEVEFTQSQAGYWGVYFSPEGSAAGASKAAPAVTPSQPIARPPEPQQKATPEISRIPAPSAPGPKSAEPVKQSKEPRPVIPVVPPRQPVSAKPASAFAAIGTKEEVLASADSTVDTKKQVAATIEKEVRAAQPAKPAPPPEEPPAPATSLSLEELRGEDDVIASVLASLDEEKASSESNAIERPRASAQESNAGVAFGARLDLGVSNSSGQAGESGQNWMMIVACAAVLVMAVGGGIAYFRTKPANGPEVQPTTSSQQVSSQQATNPGASSPSATTRPATQPPTTEPVQSASVQPNPVPTRTTQAPPPSVKASAIPARSSRAVAAPSQPVATVVPEQPATQNTAPNTLATAMDAHPVSSQRAVTQSEAPSLVDNAAASSAQPGDLPGIGSNSLAAPPPPEPVSEGPLKVGGKVQEPRLISSVMPVYPSVAKQAHVEGDVVIDTQIDKAGKVVQMKAVSGPVALRQAALDAVRRWKYAPSTLDGQPVAVQMLVTVRFRL